ncbi:MgtC/SapB family protein [Galactobacter valiniphilus]|uniref:MgtC/SapB family protein n=1 Tax=Galactobacter valiniphilus TaxID=2676122 RepID=UPI0037368F19
MNDFWHQILGSHVGLQVLLLLVAYVLCSAIGLERQARRKSAGYRTHVLVGLGSCVFTLVSAYGFGAILDPDAPRDPTRIAAQIVSGIGFLGAGVIFKGSTTVRGLTTAASIWIAAAVGMACGAGMVAVALIVTAIYLVTLLLVAPLMRKVPGERRVTDLRVVYADGTGAMRKILELASENGFTTTFEGATKSVAEDGTTLIDAELRFLGSARVEDLVPALSEVQGMRSVGLRRGLAPYEEEDDE